MLIVESFDHERVLFIPEETFFTFLQQSACMHNSTRLLSRVAL